MPSLPQGISTPVVNVPKRHAHDLDSVALALVAIAFGVLYLPAYFELAKTVWSTDEQGHGPIILAVSFWLLFKHRPDVLNAAHKPLEGLGWLLLFISLMFYVLGRSQDIITLTVGSQILTLVAIILLFKGYQALKSVWFPLFFMLFMVPLPDALVATVTSPLKNAVSAVASELLFRVGYPVGRTGVMLTAGPYQLLVADACAGLNSMFTLEALGMLYMNLMAYTNPVRNMMLATLLVPTAFAANIVRVMILVLVTYHFGDEAGQGFVHGFAGMVLFLVALGLMLVLDKILGLFLTPHRKESKQ